MKHYKRILYSLICIAVLALSIIGTSFGSIAFFAKNTAFEGESIYNYIRVEKTDNYTILSTNVLFGVQSIKRNTDGLTGMYYDYDLAANFMAVDNEQADIDILILGLCTGTFAYQSELYFSNTTIDGVEIDGKIVDLAYEYFDLSEDVNVYVNDGRSFIDHCDKKYDVIMVDAYQDITIPFQMSSLEFFTQVKNHLNDNGVMVVNMNMYTSNEGGINDYLCGTIRQVFDNAYGAQCGTNYELFACNGFDCKKALEDRIPNIANNDLKHMMQYVDNKLEFIEANDYLLTDDKAPVELLGMSVLDDMIFEELNYYRNLIRGKSINELIEMLNNGELF